MSSYLEKGKGGKGCCVFVVNGQRQDFIDKTFIIQELGMKYLRNRMMVIVDVDGLRPEALAQLMRGSRLGFYKGDIWNAIYQRVVATLKNDPDLARLESEAEEQISELQAGDEKVRHTLDQLINSHHDFASYSVPGSGMPGDSSTGDKVGIKTVVKDGVVTLLPPDEGVPADYPVLVTQPAGVSIRLHPNVKRSLTITSQPSSAWPALAEFTIEHLDSVPELHISEERLADYTQLELHFQEPDDFDQDQYPIHVKLRATARFNGLDELRQIELGIIIKADKPPKPIELKDDPTWLRVSSREPIKIYKKDADTHVRIRWDGKDELLSDPDASWSFVAKLITQDVPSPTMNYTDPSDGRFSLLIAPHDEYQIGDNLTFEISALGPNDRKLSASFEAIVADREDKPVKTPRLVDGVRPRGSVRGPNYLIKIIGHDDYETGTCWGGSDWTPQDPGCFQEPTQKSPLILIINNDMMELKQYTKKIAKGFMESEVSRRRDKYTSHITYHLYQMYCERVENAKLKEELKKSESDLDEAQPKEIRRVSLTLLRLMEKSR